MALGVCQLVNNHAIQVVGVLALMDALDVQDALLVAILLVELAA